MSHFFPTCRHRCEPRSRWTYLCRSPKLAGLRTVTSEVCRACPFADHHHPSDGNPGDDVHPDMAVERLVELLSGHARAWPPGWEDWDVTHRAHRLAADRFLAELSDYPNGRFRGRGIVIAGGGPAYFPSLYVTVRAVRHIGCSLPIQVWYLGRDNELPPDRRLILERLGVECVDADAVRLRQPCRILNGWELKVYAALHSRFEEVLSLDADCYPVRDPAYLFDEPGYRRTGAVFWPDFRNGPPLDWRPFGVAPTGRVSVESGQFLLNKRPSWRPLQLAWWFNDHSDWSYLHGYGDKHTLEVAWAKCVAPYTMYGEDVKWGAECFHHVGPDGRLLFLHRCRDKFRFGDPTYMNPQPFAANRFHAELPLEAECFRWLRQLKRELTPDPASGGATMPRLKAFMYTCPERREVREGTLARWWATDWGEDPVVVMDDGSGPTSTVRLLATAHRTLAAAADSRAEYYLFLEDDLLFNRYLRHNLMNWQPLRDGSLWMGSLFNPSVASAGDDGWAARSFVAARGCYYGAQAVVLSADAAAAILREWDAFPGAFDLRIAAMAERYSPGVVLHLPSLVQHLGAPSTWGGGPIRSTNYDPLFRAPAAIEH